MGNMVSRTLSVHNEHELLLKLETAGLNDKLAQAVIGSKGNKLAAKIVELIKNGGELSLQTSPFITHNFTAIDVSERPLKDAISAGKYDWTNIEITENNFPILKESFGKKDMALFHFDKNISSEDAVKKMEEGGYRPATLSELLAFGFVYPEIQREFPVVALGSSAKLCGDRCVPGFWCDSTGRCLRLRFWAGYWSSDCRFLAVRK